MNENVISEDASYYLTTLMKGTSRFKIKVRKKDTLGREIFLLNYIAAYVREKQVVDSEETFAYGLWLIKFQLEDSYLNVYELDENFQSWVEGAENAIYYWNMQQHVCKTLGVKSEIPSFIQNIALSEGVLEGMNVQGRRYEEPDHMSGWYITTSLYSGEIKDIIVIPIQQLVIKRKDLIQFLGLPPGFCFETLNDYKCRIWNSADFNDN